MRWENDHRGAILEYLARPRVLRRSTGMEGIEEFSYRKVYVQSRCYSTPNQKRCAWMITYKGEDVTTVDTLKEVKAFIKEKLDT